MDAIQSALLEAVDYLVGEKINQLTLDKTVVATIVGTQDVLKNTYKIRYQGNDKLVAKALGSETYRSGQSVYVLVPQNDLSKDKTILGVASSGESQENSSFVSSIMDGYTYVGGSLVEQIDSDSTNKTVQLHSWRESDLLAPYVSEAYQKDLAEQAKIDPPEMLISYKYNENEGKACALNAKKLLVRGEFRTDLAGKHKLTSCGGEYGIQVIASFKTDRCYKIKFAVKYDEKTNQEISRDPIGTVSSLEKSGYSEPDDKGRNTIYIGNEIEYETKQRLFSLDTAGNAFTGQPLNYPEFSAQYAVFDFDAPNFVGIDAVICYCKGFKPSNSALADNADIFIRNIEIYGLSEVAAVNGDYSLKLSPKTLTFNGENPGGISSEDYIGVVKAIFRKKTLSLSQNANSGFWWGKENKTVTSALSPGYHAYLSSGWEYLEDKGKTSTFQTSKAENRAYENKYRCAAVYMSSDGEKIALRDDFIIYNLEAKRDIKVTSDLGTEFAFDRGTPMLTCFVDGAENEVTVGGESNGFSNYTFYWSIEQGGTYRDILSAEEAQKRLDEVLETYEKKEDKSASYSELAEARTNVKLAAGIKYGKKGVDGDTSRNHLQLPISNISGSAVITCTVYKTDDGSSYYNVGTASITLKNSASAEVDRYRVVIENGNQSFQYSEAGVSPCNSEYNGLTTQEILPLSCHFYEANGLEVEEGEYSVEWIVPTTDTFLVFDGVSVNLKNDADDTDERVVQTRVLEFKIQDSWRYAYTSKQITAAVTYKGQEYRKDTELIFSKVGDNGTNGTEYVLKIVPDSDDWYPFDKAEPYYERSYLPEIVFTKGENTFLQGNKPTLNAVLYKSGNKDNAKSVTYSIASSGPVTDSYPFWISNDTLVAHGTSQDDSKELTVNFTTESKTSEDGTETIKSVVNFDFTSGWKTTKYLGLIANASAKVNVVTASEEPEKEVSWDTIYAAYPVPIVFADGYAMSFNRKYTMQEIVYNSDGKYPQYDADKGIKIDKIYKVESGPQGNSYSEVDDYSGFSVKLTLVGGSFDIENGTSSLVSYQKLVEKDADGKEIDRGVQARYMVTPAETYDGLYQNNAIKVDLILDKKVVCVAYVPVYMSLNRYSLASLNKWDGNSLKIEDNGKESYILAPQIGAGVKNDDNSFTGMVMGVCESKKETSTKDGEGKETVEVETERQVGLLGYAKGQQSVFIDAETGNATFGLRDSEFADNTDEKSYSGRVELRPNGYSRIANFVFGNNTLYSVTSSKDIDWDKTTGYENLADGKEDNYKNNYGTYYWPKKGNNEWLYKVTRTSDSISRVDSVSKKPDSYKKYFNVEDEIGEPYEQKPVAGAPFGIPHDKSGIIISSLPAYISVKGAPLYLYNSDIDFNSLNRAINPGESLELEIDPGKSSIFSIYKHYQDNDKNKTWKRSTLVGIDSTGKFYTNSLRDGSASMTISRIGAFGCTEASLSPAYVGVHFSYGDSVTKPIIKLFSDQTADGAKRDPFTYITKGYKGQSEYDNGGIRINAESVELYASDKDSNSTTTDYCLQVGTNAYFLGSKNGSYLNINSGNSVLLRVDSSQKLAIGNNVFGENAHGVCLQWSDVNGLVMKDKLTKLSYNASSYLSFDANVGKVNLQYSNDSYLALNSSQADLCVKSGKTEGIINIKPKSFTLTVNSKEKINIGSDIVITGTGSNTTSVTDSTIKILASPAKTEANIPSGYIEISAQHYETKDGEPLTSSITINGSAVDLTSNKGSKIEVFSDLVGTNLEKRTNDLNGTKIHGSLAITGDINKSNNALCFIGANNGLRLERYCYSVGDKDYTSETYRILRNTSANNHALEIGGNTLIEGAIRATGVTSSGNIVIEGEKSSLSVGNKTDMDQNWFNAIQGFYNWYANNKWGNYFPGSFLSSTALTGYATESWVTRNAGLSNITIDGTTYAIQTAVQTIWTEWGKLASRVATLENKVDKK